LPVFIGRVLQAGAEAQKFAWQEDADLTTQNSQMACSAISRVKFILRLPSVLGNDQCDFSNVMIRIEFVGAFDPGILTGKLAQTTRPETCDKEVAGIFFAHTRGIGILLARPSRETSESSTRVTVVTKSSKFENDDKQHSWEDAS
jgi:hypothetical protein